MIDPARLKKWLILAAVVYLIFPRDLFPDFLGRGLGYFEDLILIGLVTYYYRVYQRRYAAHAASSERPRRRDEEPSGAKKPFDPYEVLGIARSASSAEIQSAYRARMREYHPDKVAHLGEDLQKLAHDRAVEIQRAYKQLADWS